MGRIQIEGRGLEVLTTMIQVTVLRVMSLRSDVTDCTVIRVIKVKEHEMNGACSTHGRDEKCI
jgi:hypothetical protein